MLPIAATPIPTSTSEILPFELSTKYCDVKYVSAEVDATTVKGALITPRGIE
jgi:hypothetical protein